MVNWSDVFKPLDLPPEKWFKELLLGCGYKEDYPQKLMKRFPDLSGVETFRQGEPVNAVACIAVLTLILDKDDTIRAVHLYVPDGM